MSEKILSLSQSKLARQVLRFIMVGGTCYLAVMLLLTLFIEIGGLGVNPANILASTLVVALNYYLNVKFVFEPGRHAAWKQLSGYLLFGGIGYLGNIAVMYLFDAYTDLHYTVAKTLVVIFVAAFNFLTRKFLVFKG
jgi:putative flippase GtrA